MNPTTPLSEAIRLGGTLAPQCTRYLAQLVRVPRVLTANPLGDPPFGEPPNTPYDTVLHTCALGGALQAMGVDVARFACWGGSEGREGNPLTDLWPSIYGPRATCPVCVRNCASTLRAAAAVQYDVCTLITHMNDQHECSRDEIADAVKPYDEAVAQPPARVRPSLAPIGAFVDENIMLTPVAPGEHVNFYGADWASVPSDMFCEAEQPAAEAGKRTASGALAMQLEQVNRCKQVLAINEMMLEYKRLQAEVAEQVIKFAMPKFLLPQPGLKDCKLEAQLVT